MTEQDLIDHEITVFRMDLFIKDLRMTIDNPNYTEKKKRIAEQTLFNYCTALYSHLFSKENA